jgi:hypothetical protein
VRKEEALLLEIRPGKGWKISSPPWIGLMLNQVKENLHEIIEEQVHAT